MVALIKGFLLKQFDKSFYYAGKFIIHYIHCNQVYITSNYVPQLCT